MGTILIAVDQAHAILAVETSLEMLLGECPMDLIGVSLCSFEGALTDSELLHSAMFEAAQRNQPSEFFIQLYHRDGQIENAIISCSQHFEYSSSAKCCLVILQPTSSITLLDALQDTTSAWALTQTEWPYFVDMVSSHFTATFNIPSSEVIGKDLRILIPPQHPTDQWRQLLAAAAAGQPARTVLRARVACGCHADFDASCLPVVSPPSPAVRHLRVAFAPPSAHQGTLPVGGEGAAGSFDQDLLQGQDPLAFARNSGHEQAVTEGTRGGPPGDEPGAAPSRGLEIGRAHV